MVLSSLAVASDFPSGLKASAQMASVCPFRIIGTPISWGDTEAAASSIKKAGK
jgi:hypothetical protein